MSNTHPVDIHVGKKIRHRRWLLQITQQQLAHKVGVKFQQIQKYETGANRVSASRLWDIAHALDCPVSQFFVGLEENSPVDPEIEFSQEEMRLLQSYKNSPPSVQTALRAMAEAVEVS